MDSCVALVKCENYNQKDVDSAISKALSNVGGIKKYVKKGNRVLLKVNLLAPANPEDAVTTHPSLVRAMIRQIKKAGGIPSVGDCSGFEGPKNRQKYLAICQKTGISKVCKEEGAAIAHLSSKSSEVTNKNGKAFRQFSVSKEVIESDVLISMPKLKTHGLTIFTGAIKNNFGCIPGLKKAKLHLRAPEAELFAQMLVDLAGVIKPDLVVMDAIVGMEGAGPRNGKPKHIGAIIAGRDSVAVDAVASKIIGMSPFMIATTRLADEQGLGVGNIKKIKIIGEPIKKMCVKGFEFRKAPSSFFRAHFFLRFVRDLFLAKPVLVADNCKSCMTCVKHCPARAISKKSIIVFDYKKCIRCYCCQELCPYNAIKLKTPLLGKLIS